MARPPLFGEGPIERNQRKCSSATICAHNNKRCDFSSKLLDGTIELVANRRNNEKAWCEIRRWHRTDVKPGVDDWGWQKLYKCLSRRWARKFQLCGMRFKIGHHLMQANSANHLLPQNQFRMNFVLRGDDEPIFCQSILGPEVFNQFTESLKNKNTLKQVHESWDQRDKRCHKFH